ncbi:MAG: hypothetical protein AAB501_04175 [Patescibacteria group bacterium]
MSGENNAEKPKNTLGDALSSETLEGIQEQAETNLKAKLEELRMAVEEDIKATKEERGVFNFKAYPEYLSIRFGLDSLLREITNGAPSNENLKKYSEEYKELSKQLVSAIEKIESVRAESTSPSTEVKADNPEIVTPEPPTETEPPAQTQEPAKEKKVPMVREKRDKEIIERVKTESKEKQIEQISLAIERLNDQKSKLESILAKPDLPASKKGLVGRAIEETTELSQKANESKEKGIGINENTVERLWARVEKNFDIISEELLVPKNLPIESSPEGDRMTQELEQRLREAKEPPEKMDIDIGEKEPNKFEVSEKAKTLIIEMEQIKDKLDKILLEDFDIPSELGEQLNTEQHRLSGLIEFLSKDNSQPLLDKSKQEIEIAQNVIKKYEAQSASEIKMEDLEKAKPTPPPLFEITPEEEKEHKESLKLNQLVDEAFDLYQKNSSVRGGFDPKVGADDLIREAVSYLIDKAVANGILESKEAVTELKRKIAESQGLQEDEDRDNTPFDKANFPLLAEEEAHNENENRDASKSAKGEIPKELIKPKLEEKEPSTQELSPEEKTKAKEIAKELFKLHQELSQNEKTDTDMFFVSNEIDKKVKEMAPDNEKLQSEILQELLNMLDHREDVESENRSANFSEGEIPKEVINALNKVEKPEDVEKLPETIKEKLIKGFNTWGLRSNAWKDKQWSSISGNISKLFKEGGDENRLFVNIKNSFLRSRERSKEKLENVGTGKMAKIASASMLAGNILRYGRGIMDATGLSVVNPLRWATWGSMALSRFGKGVKELGAEQATKESLLDQEEAFAQAIKIYEKAGGTYSMEEGGQGTTRTALKTAYYQDVPKDLIRRLESRTPDEKRTTLQKFSENLMNFRVEKSIRNTQKKLEEIEKSSLTEAEKEQKRTEVIKKYETLLRDYDRIIDENGQINMLAMVGKRMESISKYVVTAMTLETLAELPFAVEKMWDHASQILGQHTEADTAAAFQALESQIGINSADGLDKTEILQVTKAIKDLEGAGYSDQAESVREHYAPIMAEILGQSSNTTTTEVPTGLTKTEVEETIKTINNLKTSEPERAKGLLEFYANSKVEGSNLPFKDFVEHPEKLQDIKVGAVIGEALKPFRFENPIAGNQDSIWFSTEQSFRMNPDRFGYDASKDGSVNEWAKHKTAEALKELADKKFGGKMPDLVHDGDKVIVEIDTDGKAHVNFENSSGMPAGNLPEKPALEIGKPETQSVEQAWQNAPTDSRDAIVRQFITKEMATPEYQAGDFPKPNAERIETYAKMFRGEWDKIDTPEKLAQSLFEFDNRVKEYTALILGGKFDKNIDPVSFQQLKANIFPIEGKSGKLYFTQFVDEGKWQLFQQDAQGITKQLDRKKGFLGGKTQVFDTMHVRKFLRGH